MIDIDGLNTLAKAYAMHNKIHANYVDARWGHRKKAEMQADHEKVVRHILKLEGRHLSKGEALDDTLPQELRDAFKLHYLAGSFVLSGDGVDEPYTSSIQILRTGTFHHPTYGKFSITQETLDTMVKNFGENRPKPPTEMVVDWEHMSVASPPQVAPAAGWVKGLESHDSGLFATVSWTDEAVRQIENMEYRFISPEFSLDYTDKETGKSIGPTLLAIALTNRPFIEGMQPVVLSDSLQAMLFSEEIAGDADEWWTKEYTDNLPDNSFAFIMPGGRLDDQGKTVPRALRFMPYRDDLGKVDISHVQAALERQTLDVSTHEDLTPEELAEARNVLVMAAQEAGVTERDALSNVSEEDWARAQNMHKEVQDDMTVEEQIRQTLSLAEGVDVPGAIGALKADRDDSAAKNTVLQDSLTVMEQRATTAEAKLNEAEVDAVIAKAVEDKKLTPALVEEAKTYALKDREGFEASLNFAAKIGPELGVRGKEGDKDGGDGMKLTELEMNIADRLGVSHEQVIKVKEEMAQ